MPERCAGCRSTLWPEDVAAEPFRHQVIEIPPVVAEVVEYALHALKCRRCGEITAADLPEGVPNQCAGPRLQAILSLLTARFRVTRREARDLVIALFGEKAKVSVGTVLNLEQRTSEAIKPAYDEALDAIQNAEFVHCDETGWWQGNDRAWLWAAVTRCSRCSASTPGATARRSASCSSPSRASSSLIGSRSTGRTTRGNVNSAGRT